MKLPFARRDEIDDPLPVFRSLLQHEGDEFRHDLRATDWFDDPDEADELWPSFLADFETVVARLSAAVRQPDFLGSFEDDGYPDELEEAQHLACWHFDDRLLFVLCDQQDQETPIVLTLGVIPR